MKTKRTPLAIVCVLIAMSMGNVSAQINLKKAGEALKSKAEQKVEEKVESAKPANVKDVVNKPSSVSGKSGNATVASVDYMALTRGKAIFVNSNTGSNRNDGSKASPLKNIQKAIDNASDGTIILVAEGNYFGMLNSGNINITKPVKIYGGYSSDFSAHDILKYLTMVQPTPESNGSQSGQGTMQIQVKTKGEVVIDGLIFDRGNSIAYNPSGEGQPEGVESAMMQPIGTTGNGGADLKTPMVLTAQSSEIYLDNPACNITISNCAFINAANYGIRGMFSGAKAVITNNIFINNLMAACEITKGGPATEITEVYFSYNTVLFMWSRTRTQEDMGYGYRYMTGVNSYVTNNILGLTIFSGLDRTRVDSDKAKEAKRITTAENNIFFLNKQTDLTLPGGGMFLRVKADDFDDVEQLAKASGNKTLTDPAIFKGIINEPYLNGFLQASYKETTNFDPNSPANVFRQAMGMNMTGTIMSKVSMFANRYPWKEALKFFGAMKGYGAQAVK